MGEDSKTVGNLRDLITGKEGDIGLEKKFQIEAQSAVYRKHAENINRTFADVERPQEAFGRQTGELMNQLTVPSDIQQQLVRAQEALVKAQAGAAAPGAGKQAASTLKDAQQNLNQLMSDLERSVLPWDKFERAVRKAGKAMDDALGGSRLPPMMLEGSAAAVSRMNQYAEETDPNRAVLASIEAILTDGRILWQRNNEQNRDFLDKLNGPKAGPKPKPAAND